MKIVILDRDGVINEDSPDYVKSIHEWRPVPGSLEAIARLNRAGFQVFIASNQSGVGRGLFDLDALFSIHEHMQQMLSELGGRIEGIEFAPDHPDHASALRKPGPGMLLDIADRLQITLENVPVVGDAARDLDAARAAGARPVLVLTGQGSRTITVHDMVGVLCYANLSAFADDWIAQSSSNQD